MKATTCVETTAIFCPFLAYPGLMQRLLREAGNGCGIVEEVLSSYISYIGEDLDSNDFCAKLNFLGITNPGKESLKSQASASEKKLI